MLAVFGVPSWIVPDAGLLTLGLDLGKRVAEVADAVGAIQVLESS